MENNITTQIDFYDRPEGDPYDHNATFFETKTYNQYLYFKEGDYINFNDITYIVKTVCFDADTNVMSITSYS